MSSLRLATPPTVSNFEHGRESGEPTQSTNTPDRLLVPYDLSTGTYEEIVAKRERVLSHCSPAARERITGRRIPQIPLHHEIVVDLRTGVRTVKSKDPLDDLPKINRIEHVVKKIHVPERPLTHLNNRRKINDRVSVFQVLAAVAIAYEVKIPGLIGPARYRQIAWPRHAAVKLLREERNMAHPAIGYVLGRRDHTTSMAALKKADWLLEHYPEWARCYWHAKELLS